MSNRLRLLAVALLALLFVPASAMQQSDLPPRFNVPWGNTAVAPYVRNIPQTSQIGIQNCAASLTDGFPPLTFVPASAGGCPPYGADFNGILKQITQWSRWQAAGGPVFYDATLSASIGGYPKGATIQSSVLVGRIWFSTTDNNTTNPDVPATSANWTVLPGTNYAGQPVPSFANFPPPNTVPATGLTVGNASSNATARPNADTVFLFSFLWANCPNTQCQLFNSSGGAISRGANPAADYAANNAIATYNMNGAGMVGADQNGSTFLNGAPVVVGSRTTPGSIVGETTHSLTAVENGPHTHANTLNDPGHIHNSFGATNGITYAQNAGSQAGFIGTTQVGTTSAVTGMTITNVSSGSGTPHNIVSRNFVTFWNLAL